MTSRVEAFISRLPSLVLDGVALVTLVMERVTSVTSSITWMI
jgi:hypothetical protein